MISGESKSLKISISYTDRGVNYSIISAENKNKYSIEEAYEDLSLSISKEEIVILNAMQETWMAEILLKDEQDYCLPYKSIYLLDPFLRSCLKLPKEMLPLVKLKAIGLITSRDFKIEPNYYLNNGPAGQSLIRGNLLFNINSEFLLTESQYNVLLISKEISEEANLHNRMISLSKLKAYAEETSIEFDNYLLNNDYSTPEKIDIEVVDDGESIAFSPKLNNLSLQENQRLNEMTNIQNTLNFPDGHRRKRVVLNTDNIKIIDKIKKIPKLTGEHIPKFYQNPVQYIPEDIEIDLDEFSERVKGLKKIIYRASPFLGIKKGEKGWFDIEPKGKLVNSETGEEEIISFEELDQLVHEVVNDNKEFIKHNDTWIQLNTKENLDFIDIVKNNKINEKKSFENIGQVLDIFTNIDSLEYLKDLDEFSTELEKDFLLLDKPDYINVDLYDYQMEGYSWLYHNSQIPIGSLLADDMGLGKTLQVIALIAKLYKLGLVTPSLIVLPKALMENWYNEFQKFCSITMNIYFHIGSDRIKDENFIERFHLVFTTYETLMRDQLILGKIKWKNLILDEAQKIKNTSTYVTNAVKAMHGNNRIALTGTPVENNLLELWSILDFAQPGFLGSLKEFKKRFQLPIERDNDLDCVKELGEKVKSILLRRNKKDILKNLPEKEEVIIKCSMTKIQEELYYNIINQIKSSQGNNVLAYLQQLIQLCSHSSLISAYYPHNLSNTYEGSDKLLKCMDIISEISENQEKAIIFTRYKEMQYILRDIINQKFGIRPIIINGEVHGSRAGIVESFNYSKGFNIIILSPKAAGVGLNITSANHVIHYTREWNPAVENQATDRAYRIGQTRKVKVYYPIAYSESGITVEEKLDELLKLKRVLFENTIIPSEKLAIKAEEFKSIYNDV